MWPAVIFFPFRRLYVNAVFHFQQRAILFGVVGFGDFLQFPGDLSSFQVVFSYSVKIFREICVIQFYFDNHICQCLKQF